MINLLMRGREMRLGRRLIRLANDRSLDDRELVAAYIHVLGSVRPTSARECLVVFQGREDFVVPLLNDVPATWLQDFANEARRIQPELRILLRVAAGAATRAQKLSASQILAHSRAHEAKTVNLPPGLRGKTRQLLRDFHAVPDIALRKALAQLPDEPARKYKAEDGTIVTLRDGVLSCSCPYESQPSFEEWKRRPPCEHISQVLRRLREKTAKSAKKVKPIEGTVSLLLKSKGVAPPQRGWYQIPDYDGVLGQIAAFLAEALDQKRAGELFRLCRLPSCGKFFMRQRNLAFCSPKCKLKFHAKARQMPRLRMRDYQYRRRWEGRSCEAIREQMREVERRNYTAAKKRRLQTILRGLL